MTHSALVAARDKHTEIAGELLRAGAKVRVEDWVFKGAPIHKATYTAICDSEDAGGSPRYRSQCSRPINGYTPLHDALWHGYEDCARAIIEAGARLDLKGHDGKTVLHLACEVLGEKSAVAELIRSSWLGEMRKTVRFTITQALLHSSLITQFSPAPGMARQIFRTMVRVAMRNITGPDGCPAFTATAEIENEDPQQVFYWGVKLDGPAGSSCGPS